MSVKFFPYFLLIILLLNACKNENQSVTEYVLQSGIQCNIDHNTPVILTSLKEFTNAFDQVPIKLETVDFGMYNLCLYQSNANYSISSISSIGKMEGNRVKITIDIINKYTTEMRPWIVGYLIPKGILESEITVSVNQHF